MPVYFITLLLLLLSSNSFSSELAAHIVETTGYVQAKDSDDKFRDLKIGDIIHAQDTLISNRKSTVTLLFTDGSKFELGPNTTMEISQYKYQSTDKTDTFSTRIIKGSFRFITGLIASDKPESMNINLPVATIGIRGTHVIGETTTTSAKIILLKPESPKPTAIFVSNEFGSVLVDKQGYGTEIPDEFSPPSPMRRMQLQTIDNLRRSLQNIQRVRVPTRPGR